MSIYYYAYHIKYDGSQFFGFQKQNAVDKLPTIQTALEIALSKFANEAINVICAGRTDTGVHAFMQVVNFKTTAKRTIHGWIRGVNALLPLGIIIVECIAVAHDFHARFSAITRTYHYYLLNNKTKPVILSGKIGWYPYLLNINNMQTALNTLIGIKDFAVFQASGCQANSTIKNMLNASLYVKYDIICFTFTANSFLYHMIRNIIGALIYIGNHKITLEDFANLIKNKERKYAPPIFMADGLYLMHVEYLATQIQFTQCGNMRNNHEYRFPFF